MNTLGRNQRELHAHDREVTKASLRVGSADDMAEMVAEASAAKRAWVVQLDVMMQREEREDTCETLRLIRLDELKHIRLLSALSPGKEGAPSETARADGVVGYARAAKLKLRSAEFVRRLYYCFDDIATRDIMFEIICDDTNNAIRFTLLAQE